MEISDWDRPMDERWDWLDKHVSGVCSLGSSYYSLAGQCDEDDLESLQACLLDMSAKITWRVERQTLQSRLVPGDEEEPELSLRWTASSKL